MNPPTLRVYVVRLALPAAVIAALLVLSPGIGTESGSVGLCDAWRARLGLPIDAATLRDRPLADMNSDGEISAEEHAGFVAVARHISFTQRLPRSILALQVGITLALCGAVFQVLFRNPLATPYTLGIASGGSLGALMAIRWGWAFHFAGFSSSFLAAFLGALAVVGAVFLIARGARRLTSNELLLAGVTLGLFCSAMMMVVTMISSEREVFEIVRWMMGSLDAVSSTQQTMLWPLLVPAWLGLVLMARALNQYRLGDELAASRGVNVVRLQAISVLLCTLATAVVVAQCGPIGFVGLVVPHIVALLYGTDCRLLLPLSALGGGVFLILCDWASQLVMGVAGKLLDKQLAGATLPVGVLTAIIGVPIFLVLLRARRL